MNANPTLRIPVDTVQINPHPIPTASVPITHNICPHHHSVTLVNVDTEDNIDLILISKSIISINSSYSMEFISKHHVSKINVKQTYIPHLWLTMTVYDQHKAKIVKVSHFTVVLPLALLPIPMVTQ